MNIRQDGQWVNNDYAREALIVCERGIDRNPEVLGIKMEEPNNQLKLNQQTIEYKLRLLETLIDKRRIEIKRLK